MGHFTGFWANGIIRSGEVHDLVQAAKDRTRHHLAMCRPSMPLLLQGHRQPHKRLGYTRPQGHVWAPCIIMAYPVLQKPLQVGLCEGNHEVQTFAPERPEDPFTDRIGHGRPDGRLEDLEAQMPDALVKSR
jgi:hypothetical protein